MADLGQSGIADFKSAVRFAQSRQVFTILPPSVVFYAALSSTFSSLAFTSHAFNDYHFFKRKTRSLIMQYSIFQISRNYSIEVSIHWNVFLLCNTLC